MLEFIKNIFKKKQIELVKEEVALNDLHNWLDSKKKPILENINYEINTLNSKINNLVSKTQEDIKTLEIAKLRNENIPESADSVYVFFI